MRRILIARHGETEQNVTNIIQGHRFGTLTERGLRQAELLTERLSSESIDLVFASDLERARLTAQAVSKKIGVPIIFDERLRERSFGDLEGRPGDAYTVLRTEQNGDHFTFVAPNGESMSDVFVRSAEFIDELLANYQFQTALLVTHGGTIRGLLAKLLSLPNEDGMQIMSGNCCVNEIHLADGSEPHFAKVLNCVVHLDGI
jgi:broad specificity phosphatase PhoE